MVARVSGSQSIPNSYRIHRRLDDWTKDALGYTASCYFDLLSPTDSKKIIATMITGFFLGRTIQVLSTSYERFYDKNIEDYTFIHLPLFMLGVFLLCRTRFIKEYMEWTEKDIEQIIQESQDHPSTALIIGQVKGRGCAHSGRQCIRELAKTHAIVRRVLQSPSEVSLSETLRRLKAGSVSVVVMFGHGKPAGIRLSKKFFFDGLSSDSKNMLQELSSKLSEEPTFYFFSCTTAQGDSNIAHLLSTQMPQATIYAPGSPICAMSLDPPLLGTHPTPHFYGDAFIQPIPARVFQGGIRFLTPPST